MWKKLGVGIGGVGLALAMVGCGSPTAPSPSQDSAREDFAEQGVRSIQIRVTNMTDGDFTIESARTDGGSWIEGQEATQGESLVLYQAKEFGVTTQDYNQSVGAELVLTGEGEPIVVRMDITEENVPSVNCSGQECEVNEVATGESKHASFNVTVIQN